MKAFLLILFATTIASVFGEPSPPSAEQVEEWAAFSKPVHLSAVRLEDTHTTVIATNNIKVLIRDKREKIGDEIWSVGYESKKETLSSYNITLCKAGTLFGNNRAEMERRIGEQVEKFKELVQKVPGQEGEKRAKSIQIETRPDGRKVYFTVLGYGPGGAGLGGFTTIGEYDVFMGETIDFQDVPQEQRVENPAKPATALLDIFKKLELYLAGAK